MKLKSLSSGSRVFRYLRAVIAAGALLTMIYANTTGAQEKRTVFTENNFHWKADLKPGKTLEVINRNGQISADGASGAAAQVDGMRKSGDDKDLFVEVVEYADGVTICAVYAKDATPGRCHKGGVSSESWLHSNHHDKLDFSVQVPKGVRLNAITSNGNIRARGLDSIVDAATTNGEVEVSTSEWASARSTNGGVSVTMGNPKWTGELELATTNGSVSLTLPATAEFKLRASTTNGGFHTDFPVTVVGGFSSKSVSGTVGGGGRDLRLATTNGGIELRTVKS